MNRTGSSDSGGKFSTADRVYKMIIDHREGRRAQRRLKLQHDSLVANPLITGQNVNQSVSVSLLVDHPVGYDTASLKLDIDGFVAYLAASSGAAVTKLLGGES